MFVYDMTFKDTITDKRKKIGPLAPCAPMVPAGVTNDVLDVVCDGEIIGNIEIGSDGFVQHTIPDSYS